MKVMEVVDGCHGDDMERHPNRTAIMTKSILFVECLYVVAFVCVCHDVMEWECPFIGRACLCHAAPS